MKRRVSAGQEGRASFAMTLKARDPRWGRVNQSGATNEEILGSPIGTDRNGKLTLKPVGSVPMPSDDATVAQLTATVQVLLRRLQAANILEA